MSEMQKVLDACEGGKSFKTNVKTILSIRDAMNEVLQEGFGDKLLNIDEMLSDSCDADNLYERTGGWTYGRKVGGSIGGLEKDENGNWKILLERTNTSPGKGPIPKWLLVESGMKCDALIWSQFIPVVDGENLHEISFRKGTSRSHYGCEFSFEFHLTESALVRGLERVENPVWVC